eukprot:evm.model.scf_1662.1 EVM.evm.TU.scf_1662.1   scf_1662:3094-5175(-)
MARWVQGETSVELTKLEEGVQKEQRSNFLEIGKLLTEILDNEFYVLKGYKSFVKYIDDEAVFRFTGKHAIRLVRTYRFIKSLPRGVCVPTSERQVRPLIKLGFDDARNVWLEAQRRTKEDGKPVTGELVAELVSQLNRPRGSEEAMQRRMRPHTKPHRWGQDSDASGTEDEDFEDVRGEQAVRREADEIQSAVLLLAEFERLRERAKELPQRLRERLLTEWRHALDEDLSTMESSFGSAGTVVRKRRHSVEPETPTSHARGWNLASWSPSDITFAVRKKRSKTCRAKRIWKVPSYLTVQVARPCLSDSTGLSTLTSNADSDDRLCETHVSALDIQGTCDLAYLASYCREMEAEEQRVPLTFGVPYVPIPAK